MSRLARVEVAGAAASAEAAAAVSATCEVGDPASPLIGVGSRAVCVAGGVPPPVVNPAPTADIAGRGAGTGARAAGLGGCSTLLAGGPLGGGLGGQVRLSTILTSNCSIHSHT